MWGRMLICEIGILHLYVMMDWMYWYVLLCTVHVYIMMDWMYWYVLYDNPNDCNNSRITRVFKTFFHLFQPYSTWLTITQSIRPNTGSCLRKWGEGIFKRYLPTFFGVRVGQMLVVDWLLLFITSGRSSTLVTCVPSHLPWRVLKNILLHHFKTFFLTFF